MNWQLFSKKRRAPTADNLAQRFRFRPSLQTLEDRTVPSTLSISLNAAKSALVLSGNAQTPLGTATLTPQGTGSLKTTYSGTITANYTAGKSITFTGGSITAAIDGTWQPGVGGAGGSAPADYGAQGSVSFVSAFAAVRSLVVSPTSGALTLTKTATGKYSFPSGESVSVSTGNIDYSYSAGIFGSGSGTGSIAANSATNQGSAGTLAYKTKTTVVVVVPVSITYMKTFSTSAGNITVTIHINGTLVGTSAIGPSADLIAAGTALGSTVVHSGGGSVFQHDVTGPAPTGRPVNLSNGTGAGHSVASADTIAHHALPSHQMGAIDWLAANGEIFKSLWS